MEENYLIDHLPLSQRAKNALHRMGLTTLGEVQAVHPDRFARQRNVGGKTLLEIQALLDTAATGALSVAPLSVEGEPVVATYVCMDATHTVEELRRLSLYAVDGLPLPTRTKGILNRMGISNLAQLVTTPVGRILHQQNMGLKSGKGLEAVLQMLSQGVLNLELMPHSLDRSLVCAGCTPIEPAQQAEMQCHRIEELGLPGRICKTLHRLECHDIGRLVQLDLWRIKGLSENTCEEITACLEQWLRRQGYLPE